MRVFAACFIALCLAGSPVVARASGAGGAGDPATGKPSSAAPANSSDAPAVKTDSPAKPAESSLETELDSLRDLMEVQAKQLQEQNDELKQQQHQIQNLEEKLTSSAPAATPAALTASSPSSTPFSSSIPAAGVITAPVSAGPVNANNPTPQKNSDQDQPPALRYKGITLTPGGYMAAETVFRTRAIDSDINSDFKAVPLPGQSQDHITEFNASGRQSRIAMLVAGKLSNVTIGGYYEGDFLSAAISTNNNQSNSYSFRQRQFWGQAKFDSGWSVTAGQMWSLATETRNGVDNRTEATTQTIDAQYNAGFSWTRQYGFRVAKSFNNQLWLAASVEEAQTTLTASGQNNNFLVGSFGDAGGLYNPVNNYAFNAAPDLVFKAAFQPTGWGHYEVFGVLRRFRDRVYPNFANATVALQAAGAYNDSREGGGVGANARARFFKHVDLGVHFLAGDGIGRYGSVGLPDTTVRPNGTLAPLRNFQSLGTIEVFTNKLDVYMYAGDEYSARAAYVIGTGAAAKGEGYGSPLFNNSGCWTEPIPLASTSTVTGVGGAAGFVPGTLNNCSGQTRSEYEGTLGFWYRFYRGPAGTMQFGMQESYFVRQTWRGTGAPGIAASGQPVGDDNMVFTSLRYVLP